MKRYVVNNESVQKIGKCFSNQEESREFFENLDEFVQDMAFFTYYRKRTSDETEASITLIKQTFSFISFCREYIDLIHDFIANFDCKQMTEEEFRKFQGQDD